MLKRLLFFFLVPVLLAAALLSLQAQGAQEVPLVDSGLRGLFVYSQNNWDYPSQPGLKGSQLEEEAAEIAQFAWEKGFNALFFQVRPSGDALYQSNYYPISHYAAQEQGGFYLADPLRILISAADTYGLKVYAVVNPYYIGDGSFSLSKDNFALENPQLCLNRGGKTFFDPREEEVSSLVQNGAEELVRSYSIAGILFDQVDDPDLSRLDGYYEAVSHLMENCAQGVRRQNRDAEIGIICRSDLGSEEKQEFLRLCAGETVQADLIVP